MVGVFKHYSQHHTLTVVSLFVVTIFSILALFFWWQYHQTKQTIEQKPANATEAIIKKVSGLHELPTDEKPQLTRVKDADTLQKQPFFRGVKDGDIILIYPRNSFAIIYRASANKVIQSGPADITVK